MIKNLLDADEEPRPEPASSDARSDGAVISLFDSTPVDDVESPTGDEAFIITRVKPDSVAETARKSGLAWSMGVVLLVSVVFMMILGWGADLLFGSSPWGLVVGIVIGAVIGFVQLFRLSSQILKR